MELCRILRRESEVPIIMLTAREAHADRIMGLDSGADDYIVKPFDPGEVIARAGAVLRRVKGKIQQVLTRGSIMLNETTQSVTVDGEPVTLSRAQTSLLSILMRHPNQVLTRDQLISLTFNDEFDGLDRAIDSQIAPPPKADQPERSAAHSDGLRRRLPVRGGGRVMSLRWRIMGATVVVVLLTVLTSIGVGYYATQAGLGVFVERIGRDQAVPTGPEPGPGVHRCRRLDNGGPGPVPGRIRLPRSPGMGGFRGRQGRAPGGLSPGPGAGRHRRQRWPCRA